MPSYNVSAPVFPQIGETRTQKSRIDPNSVSPFVAFLKPVPGPKAVAQPPTFPQIDEVLVMREMLEAKEDESELKRLKEEARDLGQRQGYAEGFRKGTVEGYDLGREQGYKEAYETIMGEQRELLDQFGAALQQVADRVNATLSDWFQEREEAMADLAMTAVRHLLSHELSISRDSAVSIVHEALSELTHGTHARIRVNPYDMPILEQHRSQLVSLTATLRDVEIVADDSIEAGCVVETEGGVVDTRLAVRMDALEDAWKRAA